MAPARSSSPLRGRLDSLPVSAHHPHARLLLDGLACRREHQPRPSFREIAPLVLTRAEIVFALHATWLMPKSALDHLAIDVQLITNQAGERSPEVVQRPRAHARRSVQLALAPRPADRGKQPLALALGQAAQ